MVKRFERPVIIRLILSLMIAIIVFSGIFLLANSISYLNYKSIGSQNNLIGDYVSDINSRLENFVCSDTLLFEASQMLDDVGVQIGILEKRFGKNDERVLSQKQFYSSLEHAHFKIVNRLIVECGHNFTTILFFYSNAEEVEEESERTGYILSSFKEKYFETTMVYSFDYNMNFELIDDLKQQYNVTWAPLVVVDGGEPFYVGNIQDLEKQEAGGKQGVIYLN